MNDKIKEILEDIKEIYYFRPLLDYITNLQENYDRIYNENCKLREKHNITDISLLDENNRLQEEKKDILNKLKESAIWYDDSKQLLDHITNLQEENQKLNNKIKILNSKIKLLEHNCKQAEDSCRQHRLANKNKKRRLQRREEQINLYKSRNEKAIEYMNNYNELVVPDANIKSLILKEEYKKIINLLQGKSDE